MSAHRTYTETERIGIMLTALRTGAPETAVALAVPESTIYEWFQDSGGIRAVRNFVREAETHSLLQAKRSIYERVTERVPELTDSELMVTFRAMLDKGDAAAAVSITNVQAQQTKTEYEVSPEAVAKALLTLHSAGALTNGNREGA